MEWPLHESASLTAETGWRIAYERTEYRRYLEYLKHDDIWKGAGDGVRTGLVLYFD